MIDIVLLSARTEPIQLAPIGLEHDSSTLQLLLSLSACGFIILLLTGAFIIHRRAARRSPPCDRAFRGMARRLRIRRQDRQTLRALAARAKIQPIALLLSESAFDHALRHLTGDQPEPVAHAVRIRDRIFRTE